jgi:hypothetical protein
MRDEVYINMDKIIIDVTGSRLECNDELLL